MQTLTGVTYGVVSGVASIAASGGESWARLVTVNSKIAKIGQFIF